MKFSARRSALTCSAFLALGSVLFACGRNSQSQSKSSQQKSGEKIALLFASHGDIDDFDKDLEDYIKVSFQKNVGIPLPLWSRKLVEEPAYRLSVKTVRDQYDQIGPTKYYEHSLKQAEAITQELSALIPGAKAYVGFNFSHPYIAETLEQMRKDGVTKFVVMNKGAQFSYASSGENMEDVLKYFHAHPDYDAEALGVAYYGYDPRFIDVMAKSIEDDIAKTFPGKNKEDVCIFLGSHGLPQWLINTGDSAITQMKRSVVELRKKFAGHKVYHGFLNDDFFPGAKWIHPSSSEVSPELVADGCKNIAMDGRLSFTTHHRATLYDMNVVARSYFEKESERLLSEGKISEPINAILLPNFDSNKEHAKLIAELTKETLELKGLSIYLKKKGEKALEPEIIGKPGTVLPNVTHQGNDAFEWSPYPNKKYEGK
ncbi:hypothetical protein EBU99_12875 [bacterium]|nr:hypothetical protein [bacterium]